MPFVNTPHEGGYVYEVLAARLRKRGFRRGCPPAFARRAAAAGVNAALAACPRPTCGRAGLWFEVWAGPRGECGGLVRCAWCGHAQEA